MKTFVKSVHRFVTAPVRILAARSHSSRAAAAVCLVSAIFGLGITLTSGALLPTQGEGPDEPGHFDVVTFIAAEWKLPDPVRDEGFQPRVIDFHVMGQDLKYPYVSYAAMPPGPYTVSALATKLPGDSRGLDIHQARLPQALWMGVTVLIMFLLGRAAFPMYESAAVLAAVITATWPRLIFNSSYVNNDSMMVMSTAGIAWCWWRGYRDGWTLKSALWLGVFLGLSLISKPNGWLVAALSVPVFFITFRQPAMNMIRTLGISLGMALLIASPWLWVAIRRYGLDDILALRATAELLETIPHTTLGAATSGIGYVEMMRTYWINDFVRSFFTYTNLASSLLTLLCILLAGSLVGCLFSVFDIRRRWRTSPRAVLLHATTFLALPLVFIVASINSYNHDVFFGQQGRYLLPAFPAFALYAAYGAVALGETMMRRTMLLAAGSLLLLVITGNTLYRGMHSAYRSVHPAEYNWVFTSLYTLLAISTVALIATITWWIREARAQRVVG